MTISFNPINNDNINNYTENTDLPNAFKDIEEKTQSQLDKTSFDLPKLLEKTLPALKVVGGLISISFAAITVPVSFLLGIPSAFVYSACALVKALADAEEKEMTLMESLKFFGKEGGKGFLIGLTAPLAISILTSAYFFSTTTGLLIPMTEKIEEGIVTLMYLLALHDPEQAKNEQETPENQ